MSEPDGALPSPAAVLASADRAEALAVFIHNRVADEVDQAEPQRRAELLQLLAKVEGASATVTAHQKALSAAIAVSAEPVFSSTSLLAGYARRWADSPYHPDRGR